MAKFSIAKQGQHGVLWVDIVGFDDVAVVMMESVRKGALVTVEGEEKDNTYTNRNGEKITKRQIIAQSIIMGPPPPPTPPDDDDIPF